MTPDFRNSHSSHEADLPRAPYSSRPADPARPASSNPNGNLTGASPFGEASSPQPPLNSDENAASAPPKPGIIRSAARSTREAIRKNPTADRTYRTTVGVVGTGTTALGIVMMPLPGPGALVAIGGLSILATEFRSAGKARDLGVKGFKAATAKAKQMNDKRKERRAANEGPLDEGL